MPINLIKFTRLLVEQADRYGDIAKSPDSPAGYTVMNGTASLILYAIAISLNESLEDAPHDAPTNS